MATDVRESRGRAVAADYPLLRIDGPASLPVSTDSRRLARVLFALLDNAQVHGDPPFTLAYDDRAITVCDGGPGFPPALLGRATEPFVIADRVRARGLGLGLAIAARQAVLLGARLELGNRLEGGAQAVVRFAE
jgi:signal transduction histidine kinase